MKNIKLAAVALVAVIAASVGVAAPAGAVTVRAGNETYCC